MVSKSTPIGSNLMVIVDEEHGGSSNDDRARMSRDEHKLPWHNSASGPEDYWSNKEIPPQLERVVVPKGPSSRMLGT